MCVCVLYSRFLSRAACIYCHLENMKNERFSIKFISARRIFVVGYILCSFIEVSVSTVYDSLQSVDCVEACDGESQIAVVNSEMWVGTLT